MPLVRLTADGVGPFKDLELDLSNGKGEPHLGPHILAGVNGSGKSTVLRTIAWVLDRGRCGFKHDDWHQMLRGYGRSRAELLIRPRGHALYGYSCSWAEANALLPDSTTWGRSGAVVARAGEVPDASRSLGSSGSGYGKWLFDDVHLFNFAAYSPSRALRRLEAPDLSVTLSDALKDCLAFESSVQNDSIQSWLLSLYSKRAIARERKQTGDQYTRSLERFEAALRRIYDEQVSFDVDIEPRFQPCLRMSGHRLNFSQLPDGVRSTVAWVADFMMREDLVEWDPSLRGKRPGVLLLDEVDAHLHPKWQRSLLPAMREALPDVQIIATSHSPFVISSCPNSKVHVLDLDSNGEAHVRPPVDAPIGDSVMTTLKGIFGVDSRFDILTERELNEWDELKRHEVTGTLPGKGKERLRELTTLLGEPSEELRALVSAPRGMPRALLDDLLGTSRPAAKPGRKRRIRA